MNAIDVLRQMLHGLYKTDPAHEALGRLARLVESGEEVRRLRPAYIASIPLSSEVCTSQEKDDYFAAVRRYDADLAAVLGEESKP